MTQDEIIELARKAGFRVGPSRDGPDDVWGVGANLERFAKLIAEKDIKEALAQPKEQEPAEKNLMERYAREMKSRNWISFDDWVREISPPQRTWIELTEDDKVLIKHDANFNQFMTAGEYADRVQALTEARLKDKNT